MISSADSPRADTAPRWRLLLTEPMSGVENMALDEALLLRARRTSECVWRVYGWSAPTLSIGRHQHARGAFEPERGRALGIGIVRRITGGRALLHHREITYSVTAPVAAGESLRDAYARINVVLLRALRSLGVAATVATRARRMPAPGSAPCFELPATGEIVLADKKLVGSAQLREDGAFLQHGSILIDDDQQLVSTLAGEETPVARAATLRDALGQAPSLPDAASALFAAVRAEYDAGATDWTLDAPTTTDWLEAKARYASDEWTWSK